MFKVNNEKIRLLCWVNVFSVKTKCYMISFWCFFIVDFDQSQYITIVFLLLTLNKHLSIGCERQVIMFWKHRKRHICFVIKVAKPISFSDLSLHQTEINYEQMTILWTYYRVVGSFFIVSGGWVKMSTNIFDWRQKIKTTLAKTP